MTSTAPWSATRARSSPGWTAGNQWTITVHGPGYAIVTDTTPNDGALDDDIDTIQIVGSNINSTFVTGSTTASTAVLSDGTVRFNRLIAADGVNSVVLNGFDLTSMVTPAVTSETGVLLLGGARHLEFHDIIGLFDTDADPAPTPYRIQIGQPNFPTQVKTSIYLDSIYNSVFSGSGEALPAGPITTPWVQFSVNGVVQEFSIVSATQSAFAELRHRVPAGDDPVLRRLARTGAAGQDGISVLLQHRRHDRPHLAASRGRQQAEGPQLRRRTSPPHDTAPFTSSDSGLNRLNGADFRRVGRRRRPGRQRADQPPAVPPRPRRPQRRLHRHGVTPPDERTEPRAPRHPAPRDDVRHPRGLDRLSRRRPARRGDPPPPNRRPERRPPANVSAIYSQSPAFVSLNRPNYPTPTVPGMAITNSSITAGGSIGHANIEGNLLNSAVASGYDYQAHLQGLQAARRGSRIDSYRQQGDIINSTVTASADLNDTNPVIRDGEITGNVAGKAYKTGGRNALGGYDSGVFARRKVGRLPVAPN